MPACAEVSPAPFRCPTSILTELQNDASLFQGGRIQQFIKNWEKLTSDDDILQTVRGLKLEFDCPASELHTPDLQQTKLNDTEKQAVDAEIEKLAKKRVISSCTSESGQFVSPVFTRPKKDGNHRMILNLKELNKNIPYCHFKMDTLQTALSLVTKNCYMASIDLKDAYYSVPICPEHKKFLRFKWKGQVWQFEALPNGLALAPRKFTKLLKPVFATLRQKGHISTAFIDDSLLLARTRDSCAENVTDTVQLLRSLGFIVHPDKSVFQPTQCIQYLGMEINSVSMTVKLTPEKAANLAETAKQTLKRKQLSIRDLAKVIGKIVAAFPGVKFGPLHYRHLERDKKAALAMHGGDFDQPVCLSKQAKAELTWWTENVLQAFNDIEKPDPEIIVTSDASLTGYGSSCNGTSAGGNWLPEEARCHINVLELKAALFALQSFRLSLRGKHVRIMLDNTTAVACINHMGTSHSDLCNDMACMIWQFCIENDIFLSAAHIPGCQNVIADAESRATNLDAEWKLDSGELRRALDLLQFEPDIDLFASRLNHQFDRYVSYRPDPQAHAIDSFSVSWSGLNWYIFAPFSLNTKVLQKVQREGGTGVLVVPVWPTQVWWPVLQSLLQRPPVLLKGKLLLTLPSHPQRRHPLLENKTLRLMACRVSATGTSNKGSQTKQPP